MRSVSRWLSPPPAPTREARARVAPLHAILVTNLVGAGARAIVFPFFYERWLEALLVNATISLAAVPLLRALRRGEVELVSRLTAGLGVFAVVLSIANSGGIRSPAILAFPAALMVTGFVASQRALVAVTGLLVATRLRSRRPRLPVLLVSGYTSERSPLSSSDGSAHPFLQKPYSCGLLLERIRQGLDGAEADDGMSAGSEG